MLNRHTSFYALLPQFKQYNQPPPFFFSHQRCKFVILTYHVHHPQLQSIDRPTKPSPQIPAPRQTKQNRPTQSRSRSRSRHYYSKSPRNSKQKKAPRQKSKSLYERGAHDACADGNGRSGQGGAWSIKREHGMAHRARQKHAARRDGRVDLVYPFGGFCVALSALTG